MPIYDNDLLSTQYKLVIRISGEDFRKLYKKFDKAKKEFLYSNKYYFLKTIDQSEVVKNMKGIEKFYKLAAKNHVERCMKDLGTKYGLKGDPNNLKDIPYIAQYYNDPKYAIPDGIYINMMESLINYANGLLNASSKYKFDIGGSWTNGKVILLEKK